MKCLLCDKNSAVVDGALDDCILNYLERIKAHYLSFKEKLNKSESIIEELETKNVELLMTIDSLKDDLKRASPENRKRHKTNSFEDNEMDILPNIPAVLPDKSTDDLNEALDCNEDWDDTFFAPPTQEISVKKINKEEDVNNFPQPMICKVEKNEEEESPPAIVLSPINLNIPLKRSPRDRVLPRRKPTPNKSKVVASDQTNLNTSKWISKENINKSPGVIKKYMSSPLMPQNPNPFEIIDDSPNEQENRGPKRNIFALRNPSKKLQQTKLNFPKTSASLTETFCEDLVAASPTSINVASNDGGKLSRIMSVRKICRAKADKSLSLSPRKKESSSSAESSQESIGSSQPKREIKKEPITVKKNPKATLEMKQSSPKKSYLDKPLDEDDSSIFVLPSQPNDLICIEETGENCSSVDLLNDMILQEDRLADLLRELETKSPKENKKTSTDKLEKPPEDFKTPVINPKLSNFGCSECEAYFKFIAKNLSAEELKKRLQNSCKHKKPISLHHTPEGFWDPHFRPFSPDDPRNETLIDTRFIDKK